MSEEKSPKIFKCMVNALKGIDAIGKDKKNKEQGFQYRGIDDVYNSLHNILAENGIFTIPTVLKRSCTEFETKQGSKWSHVVLDVSYKFYADDGSFVESIIIGEGRDGSDKGSNKALAIAHKYALLQAFCIPTNDDKDPDANVIPNGTSAQPPNNQQKPYGQKPPPTYPPRQTGKTTPPLNQSTKPPIGNKPPAGTKAPAGKTQPPAQKARQAAPGSDLPTIDNLFFQCSLCGQRLTYKPDGQRGATYYCRNFRDGGGEHTCYAGAKSIWTAFEKESKTKQSTPEAELEAETNEGVLPPEDIDNLPQDENDVGYNESADGNGQAWSK